MNNNNSVSWNTKLSGLYRVAQYQPLFTIFIVIFSSGAAIFETVGIGFIIPIIELVQSGSTPTSGSDGAIGVFVSAYKFAGVPFNLETVILGVAAILTVRYSSSFLVSWYRSALRYSYIRYIQQRAFNKSLNAKISYYDEEGTDDILNAIITQANRAGMVINRGVRFFELLVVAIGYASIAFWISAPLTLATIIILGGITYFLRSIIKPGYELGDIVADANERRQAAAQAGTQGIRDIRIFNLMDELRTEFSQAIKDYTRANIRIERNKAGLNNFYNLSVAVSIFGLIFLALRYANLSFSELGVFLFAMFQLGPKVSNLNTILYNLENDLPHLIRTQEFIEELESYQESTSGSVPTPSPIKKIEFQNVWFGYGSKGNILKNVSFYASRGELVAFVGQSGAGKSTIASLISRMYEPDQGMITANGKSISEMNPQSWREQLAVVRQSPYIFNDSLINNITIARRDASQSAIDRVCKIARIDQFLSDLPQGYETQLGDEGVKLSGGQKQRVALARALLSSARVLILDEATSDLDTQLEADIQRAIESIDQDYIIITIAHRLSTVKNADRIYTIEDGKVIESGSHQELINSDGIYTELYSTQNSD